MSSTTTTTAHWVRESADVVVLPPLIDCHVHFREPGLEHKANMKTESIAAHHGGVAGVCDMPNTNPPTNSIAALQDKVRRSAALLTELPDVRRWFFFGATTTEHLEQLEELWTSPAHATLRAHCCGLKLYLDNSTGNMKSSTAVTEAAFALCARLRIPLVAHCEQAEINHAAAAAQPYDGPASHSTRRPAESEVASVAVAIAYAERFGTMLHIAHLSTKGGLEAIVQARQRHPEMHITCEVAPHHLFMTTEDYSCCGARVKVNPPIRPNEHHEALWAGVLNGSIDCVATDHAPHTRMEKGCGAHDDGAATAEPPSGMPAVEVIVPLLLTVVAGQWPHPSAPRPKALADGALTMDDVVRLMHTNPNRIFSLGCSADPVRRFSTTEKWVVNEEELHSMCKWSPYHGWPLVGKAL